MAGWIPVPPNTAPEQDAAAQPVNEVFDPIGTYSVIENPGRDDYPNQNILNPDA